MKKVLINILALTVGAASLVSCSVLEKEEVPLYEGKVSIVGKEYMSNDGEPSFMDNVLKKSTEPEWLVELYIPADGVNESRTHKISVDAENFDKLEEGQTFCYTNANSVDDLSQVHGDEKCSF